MRKSKLLQLGYRDLLLFSIPSMLASVLEPISSVIDTSLVGHLSSRWLAAMGISFTLFSSLTWIFNFLIHNSTQQVSSAKGSGHIGQLRERVKISLFFSIIVGVFATVAMTLGKDLLFAILNTPPELYDDVNKYYSVRVSWHWVVLMLSASLSIIRGMGNTLLPLYIVSISTLLNFLVSYYFLYILKMDISGAAWGTVIANCFALLISLIIIFKEFGFVKVITATSEHGSSFFKFAKNSWHLFGRSFILTSVFFICTRVAATLGENVLAAYQITLQVWLFSSFFIDGLAVTANIYVARLISENKKNEVQAITYKLLKLSIWVGVFLSFLYWVGGETIWFIFTKDKKIFELISSVWVIIWITQVTNSVAYLYDGVFFGLEKFSFLRNHIFFGGLIFLVFATLALHYESFMLLWPGVVSLNIYRAISSHIKFKRMKLI